MARPRTGGRGARCPNCGRLTFHDEGPVSVCSDSNCAAVGWHANPGPPGSGRLNKCERCGKNGVRNMRTISGVTLRHCYECVTTFVVP
jgi:hypothetical protein